PQISHREAVTPHDLAQALVDFAEQGIDLLIINGGDGTVQAVLTLLYTRKIFDQPPLLALLRAGTTSMLARDVG
ncbi:MAG: diacylglycerol kinase, partial [Deltaproteobacteria bacterium]|nr:diacylglycerol kinase [Deltaproteobacteria bacterium]